MSPIQDDWDEHLAAAEFAVNNAKHESTRASPFYLNFGQHPITSLTPFTAPSLPTCGKVWPGKVPAAQQFHGSFSEDLAAAKAALQKTQS